ncbi:MAG: MarR family winged helix-turn-helix transcriptional regulator [Saccharofermentanales bacterium]
MQNMDDYDSRVNELLVRIFDEIQTTEQKALQVGSLGKLSVVEMHTLESIGLYESKTMTETAALLSVTTGTLTVAIDKLVKKGYVDRQRDLNDKRIVRIRLTRTGKLAYRIHQRFHSLLVDRVTQPLQENEKNLLLKVLTNVTSFIEEQDRKYLENEQKLKQLQNQQQNQEQ